MSEIFKIRITKDVIYDGCEYQAGMVGYADARTAMWRGRRRDDGLLQNGGAVRCPSVTRLTLRRSSSRPPWPSRGWRRRSTDHEREGETQLTKFRDQGEILKCPKCGEVMLFDKDYGFWKCPRCDGEFWPQAEVKQADLPPALVDRMIHQVYVDDLRVGFFGIKKRSGSKSGRKRKKKPFKPLPWAEKYALV